MRSIPLFLIILLPAIALSQPDSNSGEEIVSVITIRKPEFRILSDAYTRLQPVSTVPLLTDTTRFEERFGDADYCRITPKRVSRNSGRIRNAYFTLRLVKNHIDSNLCFTLSMKPGVHESGGRTYIKPSKYLDISTLCPEMRAFRAYEWIVADPYSRREFKALMRGKRWYDIRIYYQPESRQYTMNLKGADDSIDLQVYPVRNNRLIPETLQRPDPYKLYKQYDKLLNRTQKRFDANIDRQIRRWRQRDLEQNPRPDPFFSDAERAMTQEQWMEYAAKVLANEQEYLPDAPFTPILFSRYLRYQGYEYNAGSDNSGTPPARCRLSSDTLTCNIQQMFILDRVTLVVNQQTRITFDSPDTFTTAFRPGKNRVAVFCMKDGTLALSTDFTYNATRNDFTFNTEIFDPDLMTIRVVIDYLGL